MADYRYIEHGKRRHTCMVGMIRAINDTGDIIFTNVIDAQHVSFCADSKEWCPKRQLLDFLSVLKTTSRKNQHSGSKAITEKHFANVIWHGKSNIPKNDK